MSALSEQCEVLRLWAKHLREGEPILASDLREAADTILNLRDMAQQAQSEKAALERRIDELCAEVERLHADQAHWELGNCPSCPNIADLQEALEQNAKLRNILAHAVMLADLYEGLTNTRLSLDGGIVDCDWLRAWCKKLGIEVPS